MRLSEWRKRAPSQGCGLAQGRRVVEPALATLGARADPECWVVWGDDPGIRYLILVADQSGLVQINVRVNVAGRRAAGGRQARPLEPRPDRRAGGRDPGRSPARDASRSRARS